MRSQELNLENLMGSFQPMTFSDYELQTVKNLEKKS